MRRLVLFAQRSRWIGLQILQFVIHSKDCVTQRICTSQHAVCIMLSPLQLTRFGAGLIDLRAISATPK